MDEIQTNLLTLQQAAEILDIDKQILIVKRKILEGDYSGDRDTLLQQLDLLKKCKQDLQKAHESQTFS